MEQLVTLVPLFPLLGFVILTFFGKRMSKGLIGLIAPGSVLASFVVSVLIFISQYSHPHAVTVRLFDWITAGNFVASFAFLVDGLSSVFLLIITGVGFLIHVYATGYMHEDEGFNRFFSYLNLFVFFMLLLVLGDNFLLMFVGWEGVGLCSYLLIGFWFRNRNYSEAANKAFIMNRIGDLGFILGIILIFGVFGSITYEQVFLGTPQVVPGGHLITAITLLLFVGAMGKSAQIPLYTWLPDAMAGPTPVSALIHAATMVTAGIYMVSRCSVLFNLAPFTMDVIAWVGIATALLAGSIALFQNDIKKVLAYSTVSQLGLIFVALGVGAYTAGVFHVVTHAFFKALLFLGAGSVIHGMSGEQDIRHMGGLKGKMPVTYVTFLIGTLAIAGIPPFAGFFSKDQILASVFESNKILFVLSLIVSLMTAFYMFRLFFLTFTGAFRGTESQQHHLHESPKSMTVPLVVLAVLSVIGGFAGFPHALGHALGIHHKLDHFLSGSVTVKDGHMALATEMALMGAVVALIVGVILYARYRFVTQHAVPASDEKPRPLWEEIIVFKYYVDEVYEALIVKPMDKISARLYRYAETGGIDGLVNGIGAGVSKFSSVLRMSQTGNIGAYVLVMVLAMAIFIMLRFWAS